MATGLAGKEIGKGGNVVTYGNVDFGRGAYYHGGLSSWIGSLRD
jgi:hypothetical protein